MIYWHGEFVESQNNAFEEFAHTLLNFTRMEKGWYFRSSTEVSEPIVVNSHISWPAGPTQEHTIQTIHRASRRDRDSKEALARRIQNEDALNRSEKTIKMSLLCLTFRYFATVNSVKKQKINLLNERNITNESHERLKMKKEEERAKERDKLCMIWNGRATQGSHRIAKRKLHELSTKVRFDVYFFQMLLKRLTLCCCFE